MNWQHTDTSMAPQVGRVEGLRAEASQHRAVAGLLRERRRRRAHALRSWSASALEGLARVIAPPIAQLPAQADRPS